MLRGQQNLQRAQSDLYEFATRELTLEKSDFNGAGITLEFGKTLTSRIDLRTGVEMGNTDRVLDGDLMQFMEAWLVQRNSPDSE